MLLPCRALVTLLIALNSAILLPLTATAQTRTSPPASRDTTVIHSTGTGVWGAPITAVEDLRLGGEHSAQEFGDLPCIAALPDGGVAAFDARGPKGPVLLVFDSKGKLRLSLGRGGGGPGEFSRFTNAFCLAATSVGTLLMLDLGNNRVNRWTSSGTLLTSIPLPTGVGGPGPYILPGPDRSVYIRVALRAPRAGTGFDRSAYGFVRLGEDGRILDTLPLPRPSPSKAPPRLFDPVEFIMPSADGRVVQSFSDRLAFTVSSPRGVLSVSRDVPTVQTLSGERRELEAEMDFWAVQSKGMVPNPGVAPTKSATADMRVDTQGRIWFQRNVAAVKGAMTFPQALPNQPAPPGRSYLMPPVLNAFDANGRYLGEVRIPQRQGFLVDLSFVNQFIWGYLMDDDGFPVLVRWRVPGAAR